MNDDDPCQQDGSVGNDLIKGNILGFKSEIPTYPQSEGPYKRVKYTDTNTITHFSFSSQRREEEEVRATCF